MVGEPTLTAKLLAEFIGTFVLVFTIGCNVLSGNNVWGPVAIAGVLMVSTYAFGGISGGNFNPAVSFALGVLRAMGGPGLAWKEVFLYTLAQIVAALCAGLSYLAMFADSFSLEPAESFEGWQACSCEFLYTFILCFVVLNVSVATRSGNSPNQFFGLAISSVFLAGAYGAGAISGGVFNPAVALAVDTVSFQKGFGWCGAYILAELGGAIVAALLFAVVRPQELGAEKGMFADVVSEFVGTFMLVLTIGLNVLARSPAGAISIAASLTAMVYALGNVSGGHFNPAVTVAVYISGRCKELSLLEAVKFIVVQIAGAFSGAIVYSTIRKGDSFALGPGIGFGWTEVGFAETIFSFLLCYTVLCVAVSESTRSTAMFGLAIGSCVTVGAHTIGAISGGSLNPAVSLGVSFGHIAEGGQAVPSEEAAFIYTFFELAGGVLAAIAFSYTHALDRGKSSDEEEVRFYA